MVEFVLKSSYFKFNSTVKHQISTMAIGTKFTPPYACIYVDYIERAVLKSEKIQPWIWFRYSDEIFSSGQVMRKSLTSF